MRKVDRRNFARLRLAKGFRQERLPEVSGFTQQFISRLERARRDATVVTLYHFAQALGVSHVGLNARSRSLARKCKSTEAEKIVMLRQSRASVGCHKLIGASGVGYDKCISMKNLISSVTVRCGDGP